MKRKHLLILGFILILFAIVIPATESQAATSMYKLGRISKKTAYIYKSSNTKSKKLAKLKKNTHTVLLKQFSKSRVGWYRVRFQLTKNKNTTIKYGYIPSKNIKVGTSTCKSTIKYTGTTKKKTDLKKIGTKVSSALKSVPKGKKVTIVGRASFGTTKWYKCTYSKKTGYILQSDISTVDITFEEKIKAFPSSYKSKLRTLHKKYPKWEFKMVKTGLKWSTVVAEESKAKLNSISANPYASVDKSNIWFAPTSYLSTQTGCYDWSTDKFSRVDGSGNAAWYTPAKKVVEYYLDPRNFLVEDRIFMFSSFKYMGNEKKSVISNILRGTFMAKNYTYTDPKTKKKVTRNYASSFLTAGKNAGISPYFLAASARQEQGLSISKSVSGTVSGYKGYYNYYNIAANDSSEGKAVQNGLEFAKNGRKSFSSATKAKYLIPWNTPYRAICGGAKYLASGYIPVGQVCTYLKKFNVVNPAGPLYRHQYMSNVQGADAEGKSMYLSYKNMNILKSTNFTFYIPVYTSMASSTSLPAKKGNPNAYLKKLVVKNGDQALTLDKAFAYNTMSYSTTINVKGDTRSTISVSGTPVSTFGTVTSSSETLSYTGTIAPGTTKTFTIKCKSESGTTKTYTIKVKNIHE